MPQGRRVRRVVRKLDTWSVLKVAVLFYLSLVAVLILAGVLLWLAGSTVGAVENAEKFMRGVGFEDFRFVGGQLLRGSVAAGMVVVAIGTGMTVLMAVMYNLISDVVGGIQLTVLEEDTAVRAAALHSVAGDGPRRSPDSSRPGKVVV